MDKAYKLFKGMDSAESRMADRRDGNCRGAGGGGLWVGIAHRRFPVRIVNTCQTPWSIRDLVGSLSCSIGLSLLMIKVK